MKKIKIPQILIVMTLVSGLISCKQHICECHIPGDIGIVTSSSNKQKAIESCTKSKEFAEEQGGYCLFYSE